ncbi:unnamed protein product [Lampetra planeri]
MEMMNIEKVVVGSEMRATAAEIKSEPVNPSVQSYQHESLQCHQCFITFSDYKAKERHMRKSHREQYKQQLQQANTAFTCYICEKIFFSSEELTLHQATHKRDEKPFCCPYCQESFFTFTELTRHRRHACIERRCPCKDCGALFPSPSRLRNHRIQVHPNSPAVADDINTYQCCKCDRGFLTEEELLCHQETFACSLDCNDKPPVKKRGRKPKCAYHSKQEKDAEGSNYSVTETCNCTKQPEIKIPCPQVDCDLIFPSAVALRAHRKEVHGLPAPSDMIHSDTLPVQLKASTARTHLSGHNCPTRGELFAQKHDHEKTHTEGEDVHGNT